MFLCMYIYMCVHNHMHALVDVHYIFEWMGTKIKYLKAGRGREEDKVKNQNLDLKERYVVWIGEVIQEEMESETDFDWVDSTQTQREKKSRVNHENWLYIYHLPTGYNNVYSKYVIPGN